MCFLLPLILPVPFRVCSTCRNSMCNWEVIIFYSAPFQQLLGHLDRNPSGAQRSKCHHKLSESPFSYTATWAWNSSRAPMYVLLPGWEVGSCENKADFNGELRTLTAKVLIPYRVSGTSFWWGTPSTPGPVQRQQHLQRTAESLITSHPILSWVFFH